MKLIDFLKIFTAMFLMILMVTQLVAMYFIGLENYKEVIFSDMVRDLLIIAGGALTPTILVYKNRRQKYLNGI